MFTKSRKIIAGLIALSLVFTMTPAVALGTTSTTENTPSETTTYPIESIKLPKNIKNTNWFDVSLGIEDEPNVVVKSKGRILNEGSDYTVEYSNTEKPGKATVKVTGRGNYSGTLTKHFIINPDKPLIIKLSSPKEKQLLISWYKDKDAKGYQIQIAENSKFTKSKKTIFVTNKGRTKKTIKIKSFKKAGVYYARIRSYVIVDGKKIYGKWSSAEKTGIPNKKLRKFIGKKYKLGATGPKYYDCSGFVYKALNATGKKIGRYSAAGYYQMCKKIKQKNARYGDLIFWKDKNKYVYHVAFYLGNGFYMDSGFGTSIQVDKLASTGTRYFGRL